MTAILLDEGLAPATARILREHGFDAVHVSEVGLERNEDPEILAAARNQHRICVTLDHDFHTHLALAGQGRPSVILLRIVGNGSLSPGRPDRVDLPDVRCRPRRGRGGFCGRQHGSGPALASALAT